MLTKKNYNEIAEILFQYKNTRDNAFHDLVGAFTSYFDRDNDSFNWQMFEKAVYEIQGKQCPWLNGQLCDSDCHHQQDGTE